jgi:hypothetical protein
MEISAFLANKTLKLKIPKLKKMALKQTQAYQWESSMKLGSHSVG